METQIVHSTAHTPELEPESEAQITGTSQHQFFLGNGKEEVMGGGGGETMKCLTPGMPSKGRRLV